MLDLLDDDDDDNVVLFDLFRFKVLDIFQNQTELYTKLKAIMIE